MESSESTSILPSHSLPSHNSATPARTTNNSTKLILFSSFSVILLLTTIVSAGFLIHFRTGSSHNPIRIKTTMAISNTCSRTHYPSLCTNSLLNIPDSLNATESQLVHISLSTTLRRMNLALYGASAIANTQMGTRERSAFEDCLELLEDSMDHITRSLKYSTGSETNKASSREDVTTWLSAALTNQDTCMEGFEGVSGTVKDQMVQNLRDVSELVSNSLAIYAISSKNKDFDGIPIENRKRKLLQSGSPTEKSQSGFPGWLRRKERRLMDLPAAMIKADIIVSKDGNGTYKTVAEAIKAAPEYSNRRTIIYVKAGRYEENNLKVGRKKINLMFIGDGKGRTVISGGRSVLRDNITTFHTASFAASGTGFIARDITFVNWAGPGNHQAVALRVSADHAVVYRCSIVGYQDTLYVHSQRQFFRECDIYGTVDFIFGNAAVVIQNCSIYARKPMDQQKNTITAQNRKDPNQNTGISIHGCRILATPDLQVSKGSFSTYLGRPWKLYSRTVYLQTYIGDHVHPRGWLEWNATFALDTLYYGEYMNYGPGGSVGQRVAWPGYRVITLPEEANKFTVGQFIYGKSWLPSTGVAFLAGLTI
ncbi:Pectinesterase/pectinesterase inhibitor [Thalictrum thalictroides]|uniref:Pectinesterase n=1 Tax=Thalictrum thalictroides TaxID=46969 RepID=A0A7J6VLI1_THATH|nr:Pectinesterase/pectinesterase inhibitor [Thalictrum thalictroides]